MKPKFSTAATALACLATCLFAADRRSLAGSKPNVSRIFGKIQFVESFPDFKVQVVDSFPDLKVKRVASFPDSPGKWQIVQSFPDFKIQIVSAFPDFKIQYVDSFPGVAR